MSGPDVENQHHWREKELEDELHIQEQIIDEMDREIKRVIQAGQQRLNIEITVIQNQRRYVQAHRERDRIAIELMGHRNTHGSYRRIVPENMLSEEEIARREEDRRSEDSAHEARERLQRAPGGSARRNSHMRTSPINASPQTPIRFATIGGTPPPRSAFTTPPRINRSPNQEPPRNPNTSPVTTPPNTRQVPLRQSPDDYHQSVPDSHLRLPPIVSSPGDNELAGPLVSSPSDALDGRRPGNRQTRSAEGSRSRGNRTEQFKPTLKF